MLRKLLALAAVLLTGSLPIQAADESQVVEIRAMMSSDGTQVYFDPVGIHIRPGQTVRWVQVDGYHSVAAYHPANGNRPLRIPPGAQPWDSGLLTRPGATFEHRFTQEGVYDYFCQPHEAAGMVGRIVVGDPGTDVRQDEVTPVGNHRPVPEAALKNFPPVAEIMAQGVVRGP